MIELSDKVGIVTGGASGIGEATVRTMASLGAKVVIADVDVDRAEALAAELGEGVAAVRADITEEADIAAMVAFAVDRFGGLDILHNNAGIPRTRAPDFEVTQMPLDKWNLTIAAHLTSVMLGAKHALPHMVARGGGAIVNTSSGGALSATVDLVAYSSAKAGVHQLTREIAATYGRDNVRCNAVVPGAVMTDRARLTMTPEMLQMWANETPLPRLSAAQDIANVAVFLMSDASRMINGQSISVDGGMMIKLPYWLLKMRESRGPAFDAASYVYESPE